MKPILPGATVGVLGSGQLGRMFAIAARRMGYRVHTFSPDSDTPTGQVADREYEHPYDDLDAVREFARGVAVVTFEFENVPAEAVEAAAALAPVRPSGAVLYTTQHRLREKTFLNARGFPVAPFRHVRRPEDLRDALAEIGFPAVLKTAGFGYDGKGQTRIDSPEEAAAAFDALRGQEGVVEAFVDFEREVSVVAARGRGRRVRALRRRREHAQPTHPRPLGRARARRLGRGARGGRDRARRARRAGRGRRHLRRVLPDARRAVCSSTSWRRARTTRATSPSTPP